MRRIGWIWLLVGAILAAPLSAKFFSYQEVHAMPKSVEKDYYIWRFLTQKKTSKKEAHSIIREARYINGKLKKAYRKKTGKNPPSRSGRRKPLDPKVKAAIKKKKEQMRTLLRSKDPVAAWTRAPLAAKLFTLNHSGTKGRKLLDHTPDLKTWLELTTHKAFNLSIRRLYSEGHKGWRKATLYPPARNNKLTYKTHMKLGFHALKRGKKRSAAAYFSQAAKKGHEREEVDRAHYWYYLATADKSILNRLAKSYDINIYTLLARDKLKIKYPKGITPDLPKAKLIGAKKISDPIYWAKLKRKIFSKKSDKEKLAKAHASREAIGYYTYIKAKQSRETEQYFPVPYRTLLGKLSKSRQAILYAIARQESRFIPASVSATYALGMMQIMPFLVDHLAKKRKESIDYDAMFDPKTALVYANEHMNYLTKWLTHPLFIAYAYNAGIGYTRRMLRQKTLFAKKGNYEPLLSLEKLNDSQANRYGKHVLTNYVIYMNKLGSPLRMSDLLSTLHIPAKTDKFRK